MPAVRTVLVTGVSGHVAGAMADRPAAGGLRVRAMVRTPDQARMAARRGWTPVRGDLAAPGPLGAAVEGETFLAVGRCVPVRDFCVPIMTRLGSRRRPGPPCRPRRIFEENVGRLADLARSQPAASELCPPAGAARRHCEEPG